MPKMNDAQTLEQFRVALENATNNATIAASLAEIGYDETVINEGKALLQTAQTAFNTNQTEDDETTVAYSTFTEKKETIESAYRTHRKKAKVIFRTDPVTLDTLALKGIVPKAYVAWVQAVKKFYDTANASEEIKTMLARLAITEAELTAVDEA